MVGREGGSKSRQRRNAARKADNVHGGRVKESKKWERAKEERGINSERAIKSERDGDVVDVEVVEEVDGGVKKMPIPYTLQAAVQRALQGTANRADLIQRGSDGANWLLGHWPTSAGCHD